RLAGGDRDLLAGRGGPADRGRGGGRCLHEARRHGERRRRSEWGRRVKVDLWGTRGSVPSPGPETIRYGGNTSCVGVTLADGSLLALDAGTGIRNLGLALPDEPT